jgi:hypothetical protein
MNFLNGGDHCFMDERRLRENRPKGGKRRNYDSHQRSKGDGFIQEIEYEAAPAVGKTFYGGEF